MLQFTYAGLSLVTAFCYVLIILGARRFFPGTRIPVYIAAGLALWLSFTFVLAETGELAVWDTLPPRVPLIPLTAFAAIILLNQTARMRQLLTLVPLHWPVMIQSFRVGVELAFWGLFTAGAAPMIVTFEGRNFDVLVGLSAPIVAFLVWKFKLPARLVIAWNILGIAILSNTIFTVLTASPGPLHRDWPGVPFTAFAAWPFVWIPAFLAPFAIFLHVFSIRQNLSRSAR